MVLQAIAGFKLRRELKAELLKFKPFVPELPHDFGDVCVGSLGRDMSLETV